MPKTPSIPGKTTTAGGKAAASGKVPAKAAPTPPPASKAQAPRTRSVQAKDAAAAAAARLPKHKLVRDSFTIPRPEYAALDALKHRLVLLARPSKKSEVLRAGIKLLVSLSDPALLAALAAVPSIKTGRPGKQA
jgi:hypothetical protein